MTGHGSCVSDYSQCVSPLPTRRTNRVIEQRKGRTKDDDRFETVGTTNKGILR